MTLGIRFSGAGRRRLCGTLILVTTLILGLLACSSHQTSVPSIPTPPPKSPTSVPVPAEQPSSESSQAPATSDSSSPATSDSGSKAESAAGEPATAPSGAGSEANQDAAATAEKPAAGGAPGGAATAEEERGELDRNLDSSLSEFDAILLRERKILEERREAGGTAGTEMGTAGEDPGASGAETAGSETAESGQSAGGLSGGSPDTPSGEPVESEDPERSGGDAGEIANGRIPPDVGDGSDDDIVARQLREAAMKEDDPELREKLWDEYRAYKKGIEKKSD